MGGGSLTPFFFGTNLLVWVKLGYPLNFKFLGKPLLGEKYVEGKKKERKKKERRRKNNAKFSGHYVRTTCVCKHYVRTNISVCITIQSNQGYRTQTLESKN